MDYLEIRKKSQEEFQNLRFGMFVHFGLYSQGKEHEWHQNQHRMSHDQYKKQFLWSFDPDPKGMEQWVLTAKNMGAKYIVCTSKHHDGFCLWDTKMKHEVDPEYHIRSTPFWKKNRKGVLDYLFEAGRKHGIRIGIYYSTIDWSWTQYPKKKWFFSPKPNHPFVPLNKEINDIYVKYYQDQVLELMDLYPDMLVMWFDGYQFKVRNPKEPLLEYLDYKSLRNRMTKAHPDILISNNSGKPEGSGSMGEADVLGFENSSGRGEQKGAPWPRSSDLPGEVCLTINKAWGYAEKDKNYKTPVDMQKLVLFNSVKNANTLLNFGPKPDGFILDEQVEIAQKIGNLLKPYEKVLYNSRSVRVEEFGGIIKNLEDKQDYLYINSDSEEISIKLEKLPKNTDLIAGNESKVTIDDELITLNAPKSPSLLKIHY